MPGRYVFTVAYRYDGREDFTTIVKEVDFVPLPAILACLTIFGAGAGYGGFKLNKKSKKAKALSQADNSKNT